jgi:hypothetical protein
MELLLFGLELRKATNSDYFKVVFLRLFRRRDANCRRRRRYLHLASPSPSSTRRHHLSLRVSHGIPVAKQFRRYPGKDSMGSNQP